MSMWEDVKRNLMEWYAATSDKTVEVARVTTLRYDKFGISRDIERQFSELGNLVYTGLKEGKENFLADPAVAALMDRLDVLEQELKAKEDNIEATRNQHRARQRKEGAATVEDPQSFEAKPASEAPPVDPGLLVSPEASDAAPVEPTGLDQQD